jgi:hypothetical protein
MIRGPLAQLAEQLTLNQRVPGSSPGRVTVQTLPAKERPEVLKRTHIMSLGGMCRNWQTSMT